MHRMNSASLSDNLFPLTSLEFIASFSLIIKLPEVKRMTPELIHEDLSRVGCQHSWQERQRFALPGHHRWSVLGSSANAPHQLQEQPSAELPKATRTPQELLLCYPD